MATIAKAQTASIQVSLDRAVVTAFSLHHGALPPGTNRLSHYRTTRETSLLRDVDFLFLVHVAQEIDQGADEKHHATTNRPPHVMRSHRGALRVTHEEVESVNSIPERAQSYDYSQHIFHF